MQSIHPRSCYTAPLCTHPILSCLVCTVYFLLLGIVVLCPHTTELTRHIVNVRIFAVINFAEEALTRTDEIFAWKNFCAVHPTWKYLYQHTTLYYQYGELQLAIYGRVSWQLHSRHTVVCRVLDCYADTGVSQWTIGSGEWRHDCVAVVSEDATARQWRVKTRLCGGGEWRHNCAAVANEVRLKQGHFMDYIFAV